LSYLIIKFTDKELENTSSNQYLNYCSNCLNKNLGNKTIITNNCNDKSVSTQSPKTIPLNECGCGCHESVSTTEAHSCGDCGHKMKAWCVAKQTGISIFIF